MKEEKHSKVLLFSGGVDSYVAYHFLGYPQTVYFNLRNRYAEKELKVVQDLIPDTIIDESLNLGVLEDPVSGYIPFRNLLVACQAVRYADEIVIAGVADDRVSDKNENVFMKFSTMLSELEGRPIRVTSPFWTMTKADVVGWFIKNVNNRKLLNSTVSCYHKTEMYCAKCPACFRKWLAFWVNGIQMEFLNIDLMFRYFQEAYNWKTKREGKGIHEQRADHTIKAVREYFARKGIDTCLK